MSNWFLRSNETIRPRPVPPKTPVEIDQSRAVPPESPAEQTTELFLFSHPRHRPLLDWMTAQTPTEPLWPAVDLDEQP
jgi:hypothetical protein